ncbi:MAG TPA: NAD(P)H-hydrate dehydratase [Motilibacteraceae bacterium]|nr:NAD(P)H-hydrate dehydratase [Motilibacteraceae bacterium]
MSPKLPADPPVVLTPGLLRGWPVRTPDGGGKHARGSVVVVGGSTRTPGAVLLAGVASLRAGAGRLTLAVPRSTAVTLAVQVPECGSTPLPETGDGAIDPAAAEVLAEELSRSQTVLLGPGMADPDATSELLARVLPAVADDAVVVLDAMALGCLGARPELADAVRGRLVLTPNGAEAARLLGDDDGSGAAEEELDVAARIAHRFGAVVAHAGAVAACDGRRWLDQTGQVGLGTSGSGDVLAGLVAGVAARGGDPAQAACWGTHLHGAAGDRLAARIGRLGFLARELLDEAPRVLAELSA